MNLFKKWWDKETPWYYFWFPRSGLLGGSIMGALITIACLILSKM